MKLSVLMITRNHGPYIRRALDSALAQRTSFDYEIVIGEDCSDDDTRTIVEAYALRYPNRVRLLPGTDRLGMHRNFVRTYRACDGDYIAVLEGDDYWTDRDKLQCQADLLDAEPECAICFHPYSVVADDDSVTEGRRGTRTGRTRFSVEDLFRGNFIGNPTAVYRNGLIKHFPSWIHQIAQADWVVHILNARHGGIAYIDRVMAAYRRHGGGAWSSLSRISEMEQTLRGREIIDRHLPRRLRRINRDGAYSLGLALAEHYQTQGDVRAALRYLKMCWRFGGRKDSRRMGVAKAMVGLYLQMIRDGGAVGR